MREEGKAAPRCPFCGAALPRPTDMTIGDAERATGGTCSCGAIFLVDPTGKNVGTMMAQALNMMTEELKKGIGELVPDEDYQDAVLNYDWRTHRSTGVSKGYMDGYGRLYIFKVKKHR